MKITLISLFCIVFGMAFSQPYMPLSDSSRFKSDSYIPKINVYLDRFLYVDTFLSQKTELPPFEWGNIQSRPDFKSVAYSGNYSDLAFAPDLNHLPNYYEKGATDTMYKSIHYFPELSLVGNTLGSGGNTVSITTTNVVEGTGLYWTTSRFNSSFSGKSTSDLSEGANLYYTSSRFNASFAAKSTSDLAEGGNLYYTNARVNAVAPTLSGSGAVGTWGINTTGNAGTATKLSTARTINGVSFDGTSNITVPSVALTYNSSTRTFGTTGFTPSPTPFKVYYTITISCTATIGSNASGSVALQYFDGSVWQDFATIGNSNTVTLAIALNSVNTQTAVLSGEFPGNTQIRLNPTSSGTTAITFVKGREVY